MVDRPPLSPDDREHLRWAREFESLIVHPGWKIYMQILNGHLKMKEDEAVQVVDSVDQAMRQNAAKGAVLMGRLARDIPSGIIKVAKDIRGLHGEEEN